MRKLKKIAILALCLWNKQFVFSQTMADSRHEKFIGFKGLGFDNPAGGKGSPWMVANPASLGYVFSNDDSLNSGHGQVFHISGRELPREPSREEAFALIQKWPLVAPPGKRLQVSGWLKGAELDAGDCEVVCWLTDGNGNILQTMKERQFPVPGDSWRKLTLKAGIPQDTRYIVTGIIFQSRKDIWVSGFGMEVDGVTVVPPAAVQGKKARVTMQPSAFGGFSAKGADVIAFGEYCHGSKPILSEVFRQMRKLVEEGSANAVFLETGMDVGVQLNEYISGQRTDLAEILSMAGHHIANKETKAFLEWLKARHAGGKPLALIAGIDMQLPTSALDAIQSKHPEMTAHTEKVYNLAVGIMSGNPVTDSLYTALREEQLQYARLPESDHTVMVTQFLGLLMNRKLTDPFDAGVWKMGGYRDSCMAANALRYLRLHPSLKPAILAHNGHVMAHEGTMGGYLRKHLGKKYQCFGTVAGSGSFGDGRTGQAVQAIAEIPPTIAGSLENWLSNTMADGYLPLHDASQSWSARHFLFNLLGMGQPDAMHYTWTFVPREIFDGIFYFAASEAVLLKE